MTTETTIDRINRIGEICDTICDAEALGWRNVHGACVGAYYYEVADDNDGIPEHLIAAFTRDANSAATFLADNAPADEYDPAEHALRRWEAAQQEG